MRLAFILLFFATAAHGQIIINPYWFAQAGIAAAYTNERSLNLGGGSEYVTVPDSDDLSFTNDSVTIAVWASNDNNAVTASAVFVMVEKEGEYLFWINSSWNLEARFIDAGGDYIGRKFTATLQTAPWRHCVATFDGTTVKIYYDGRQQDNADVNSGVFDGMINKGNALTMGTDGVNYKAGYLDQFVIFNATLDEEEVRELTSIRDLSRHSRADNIVSWWDFDDDSLGTDNITDLIGTNHGTAVNMEYSDFKTYIPWPRLYQLESNAAWDSITPMQYGFTDSIHGLYSYNLDGAAEYIDINDGDALSFTNDTISISAWVRMDDATNFVIAEKEGEYLLWVNASDKLEARFIDAEGDYIGRTYNTAITQLGGLLKTVHICATFDGSNVNLYINGQELDDTDANSGTYGGMTNTANNLTIGYDGTNYADGVIGDVLIYDKVLTSAEVLEVYNAHAPRNETYESLSGNIAGYWRAYNSTLGANAVIDQSGNGNDGTATAMESTDMFSHIIHEVWDSDNAGSFNYDGSTEYDSIPDASNLSFTDGAGNDDPFSVSFFFKWDVEGAGDTWVSKRSSAGSEWYAYWAGSGIIRFRCTTSDNANYLQAATTGITWNAGRWYHMCFTYDGSNDKQGLTIYRDGTDLNATRTESGTYTGMSDTDGHLNFGSIQGTSNFFDGNMSHVTLFDKELTSQEVREVGNTFSLSLRNPVDITKLSFADNIISHWKLNQTDSPTAVDGITDIIGTNHGTHVNGDAGDLQTLPGFYPTP